MVASDPVDAAFSSMGAGVSVIMELPVLLPDIYASIKEVSMNTMAAMAITDMPIAHQGVFFLPRNNDLL